MKFKFFLWLVVVLEISNLAAAELESDKKLGACIVSRSPRVSSVLFQDFLDAVNARFAGECKTLGVLVDDPFSESNKSLVSSEDRFGFWIDADLNGVMVLIRGIDYQTRLYWGQIHQNISASRPVAQDQLTAFVSELLNDFHYLGIISSGRFFSWNPQTGPLLAVKRANVDRHPFLPYWLKAPSSDQVIMKGLSFKNYSKSMVRLQVPEQNTLFSQGDLWLVSDSKND